ncbi:(2Fe-2S)-binding protein [Mycolicibacterium parafortuitum]|uniref:Ferric siderophore reductase C-terminal domain-containing protein n=1 Tax=Mycolicibacterium parafortuitum TaxID=39692 RepID=A0A375YKD9_MYCPF|nr:(2Fe-2S)-binding protein [Mycolicibacterium parafortuitum]ORB26663.1 hypothetical protein BST38_25775 [Mycolicibacterium parafortuitum]SRX81600.1 hypothetical protein [Saccharothrix espanaensis DSM 44229] [Mycolicibacterium parafortuitum]
MTAPVRSGADRTRRALKTVGMIGPYFSVGAGACDGFVRVDEFCAARHLDAALAAVARRIGSDEARVAASSLQYEFAERLWSVTLGCWHLDKVVLDLRSLVCQAAPNGRIRFRIADPDGVEQAGPEPARIATSIAAQVIPHLTTLHRGLRAGTRVADGLLWGNAATGAALATRTLTARDGDRRVGAVAEALLAAPPMAGHLHDGGILLRRTCCLYYRTAARRTCGDCPLTGSVAARRRACR